MAYFGCINKSSSPPTPPTPPTPTYLYKWDFTKAVDPLVDEVQGQVATANNVSPVQGVGITFNENNIDKNVLLINNIELFGKTVEIDVENISSTLYRKTPSILGYKKSNNSNWVGFNTQSNKWECIVDSSAQPYTTSSNTMGNGVYKFVFGNDITSLNIYLNDELIYNGYGIEYEYSTDYIFIGGTGYVFNMTIKSIKIYENEEE